LKKNLIVFLFCLLIPFSVDARQDSLVMNLKFKPNQKVKVHPHDVPAVKIFFERIKDARSNLRSIGENLEHRKERIPVFSSDNDEVSHFVHSALIKEFRSKNFSVEDQAGTASKIITGTILKFWTVETSNYSSQTQLRIEVKDKAGRVYHSRTYTGTGKNRGRSLQDNNYYECMSDSMISIIDKLFSDHEFLSALSDSSPPSAATRKKSTPAQAPLTVKPGFGPK
jgi:hypothetical protein